MAQQTINLGTVADDGTGDTFRVAFTKCDSNFTELYTNVAPSSPDSSYVAPTFSNGWGNFGSFYDTAGYKMEANKKTWLKGSISGGTASAAAFTLPVGRRPGAAQTFVVDNAGAYAYVTVGANGTVTPVGGNTRISLDGISFTAV